MLALASSAKRVRKFHKERTFIVFLVILLVDVRHLYGRAAAQSIVVTTKLISSYSQVNFFIYDKADIINLIEVINDQLLIIEYIIKKAARIGPPWKVFSVS